METIQRDYASKGVKFYYIYKALAHPENNGYITPFTLKERLMHVAEAKKNLDTKFDWICDSMDNDLKHALGDRPNSEFVIDPQGKVVVAREWSKPDQLRNDLVKLVGKVANPTRIADLDMKPAPRRQQTRSGVVERVKVASRMSPLITKPIETPGMPHYAKLRVESGADQLYLGIFLDPLYKVHWNNKAPALEYSIDAPAGITIDPAVGKFPKVNVDADADPREFLVGIKGRSSEPLKITIKYFACDDAETFCKPVTQEYLVTLKTDRDGGSRRSAGRERPSPSGRGGSAGNDPRMMQMMQQRMAGMMRQMPVLRALDKNQDGTISSDEIDQAPKLLLRADRNRDGEISREEMRPRGR